jgi:predicted membrane protein
MNKRTIANAAPQLIFGGFVIVVGFLFLLDNMGLINAGNFFDYWPSIFIIIGLARIVQADTGAGRMVGFIFALVGFFWILDNLQVFEFSFGRLWPLVLMLIGLVIIWKALAYSSAAQVPPIPPIPGSTLRPSTEPLSNDSATGDSEMVQGAAVLGGYKRVINSRSFRGGNLFVFMGGCEIDLRDASISSAPAVLDIFAMWGGVELKVPTDWVVELRGMPILGGFEDKSRPPQDHSKRLVVKGMVIMGGVEIKN